jgi:hypothetical protein
MSFGVFNVVERVEKRNFSKLNKAGGTSLSSPSLRKKRCKTAKAILDICLSRSQFLTPDREKRGHHA